VLRGLLAAGNHWQYLRRLRAACPEQHRPDCAGPWWQQERTGWPRNPQAHNPRGHTHTYTHTYTHIHTYTHTHTLTHSHTHTHLHTHTYIVVVVVSPCSVITSHPPFVVPPAQSAFVTILSVCNCLGRLFSGYLSDRFSHVVSKELLFVGFAALMALAHFVLSVANINTLYLGCMLIGTAYGAYWSLGPCILCDLVGTRSYGRWGHSDATVLALRARQTCVFISRTDPLTLCAAQAVWHYRLFVRCWQVRPPT
jgi:hypothetical protein